MSVVIKHAGASLNFGANQPASTLIAPFAGCVGLISADGRNVYVADNVVPPGEYTPLFPQGASAPSAAPPIPPPAPAYAAAANNAGDDTPGEDAFAGEEEYTVFNENDNPFDDAPPAAAPPPVPAPPPALPARPAPAVPAPPPSAAGAGWTPDPDTRRLVIEFYQQYNPAKLRDPTFDLDATLLAYRGKEDRLFEDLRKKYATNPPPATPNAPPAASSPAPAAAPRPKAAQPSLPPRPQRNYDTPASKVVPSIIEGLKTLYRTKIKPLETMYKFHEFHSALLTDTDLEAKPMVLLLGQYSTGKTSFIKYMLEREFPGQRIGPEPTTDRFVAVMWGPDERVIPGNALAVQADKPFTGLTKFGMAFLNKFEGSLCPSPILEKLTFIDTPGVLSGEKQRIGRSYDFADAVEYFAERADRILLLFDAHKLDISDEFKNAIEMLKGQDDKIRVILNKADMISGQALMRVYGALMWSLGKVIATPEVLRVYIGSFWDQPLQNNENAALFEAEMNDLLADLRSLPRNSAVRKVNELVKRARMAKVHAYIISHLRNQFGWFGKDKTQNKLVKELADEFRKVQRQYNLPKGDFPNLKKFQENLMRYEIHKFPKLDESMVQQMDQVLAVDIPRLMRQLPGYDSKEDNFTHGQAVNPFDSENESIRAAPGKAFQIDNGRITKYENVFQTLRLVNGKAPGGACKSVFMQSGLGNQDLKLIWDLSDIDKDGMLDSGEFAVAMFLIDSLKDGSLHALPAKLPYTLVPPNKRHQLECCRISFRRTMRSS